jgi:hypothetical protein
MAITPLGSPLQVFRDIHIDVVSIDIDIYDVEYTGQGFIFYGTRKNAGSDSHLARYVEGFTGDPSLCAPFHSQGGLGGIGFPGP